MMNRIATLSLVLLAGFPLSLSAEIFVAGDDTDKILIFNNDDDGDVAPKAVLAGPDTRINGPTSVFIYNNELYVSNDSDPIEINVFPVGASGNYPPTRTLATEPSSYNIHVHDGEIFAATYDYSVVNVYDASASGDPGPVRTIENSDFYELVGIVVYNDEIFVLDHESDIWVDGDYRPAVFVFDIDDDGDVSAKRVIVGTDTELDDPWGIEVANGEIFVMNDSSITVYPVGADGDVTPTRVIEGPDTTLDSSESEDSFVFNGELFVSNYDSGSVTVFNTTDDGDVTPQRNIIGDDTQLEDGEVYDVYVTADVFSDSVTFFTTLDFSNGSGGTATLTLTCNAGLPLSQEIEVADGSNVTFTVTNLPYDTPGIVCEITASGVAGYELEAVANGVTEDASCVFDTSSFRFVGANVCAFSATPDSTAITVNTDFENYPNDDIASHVDTDFETVIICQGASETDGSSFGEVEDTDTSGIFTADWYADPDGGADCTVVLYPDSDAVEGDSCEFSFAVGDEEAGCDVVGTVFFEGVPTLGRYGMALMALLMLGVGFIAVRRFA